MMRASGNNSLMPYGDPSYYRSQGNGGNPYVDPGQPAVKTVYKPHPNSHWLCTNCHQSVPQTLVQQPPVTQPNYPPIPMNYWGNPPPMTMQPPHSNHLYQLHGPPIVGVLQGIPPDGRQFHAGHDRVNLNNGTRNQDLIPQQTSSEVAPASGIVEGNINEAVVAPIPFENPEMTAPPEPARTALSDSLEVVEVTTSNQEQVSQVAASETQIVAEKKELPIATDVSGAPEKSETPPLFETPEETAPPTPVGKALSRSFEEVDSATLNPVEAANKVTEKPEVLLNIEATDKPTSPTPSGKVLPDSLEVSTAKTSNPVLNSQGVASGVSEPARTGDNAQTNSIAKPVQTFAPSVTLNQKNAELERNGARYASSKHVLKKKDIKENTRIRDGRNCPNAPSSPIVDSDGFQLPRKPAPVTIVDPVNFEVRNDTPDCEETVVIKESDNEEGDDALLSPQDGAQQPQKPAPTTTADSSNIEVESDTPVGEKPATSKKPQLSKKLNKKKREKMARRERKAEQKKLEERNAIQLEEASENVLDGYENYDDLLSSLKTYQQEQAVKRRQYQGTDTLIQNELGVVSLESTNFWHNRRKSGHEKKLAKKFIEKARKSEKGGLKTTVWELLEDNLDEIIIQDIICLCDLILTFPTFDMWFETQFLMHVLLPQFPINSFPAPSGPAFLNFDRLKEYLERQWEMRRKIPNADLDDYSLGPVEKTIYLDYRKAPKIGFSLIDAKRFHERRMQEIQLERSRLTRRETMLLLEYHRFLADYPSQILAYDAFFAMKRARLFRGNECAALRSFETIYFREILGNSL